jgi:hypothetical protein
MVLCSERQGIVVVRWTPRILGSMLLILIAAFAIGEGIPGPIKESLHEQVLTIGVQAMIFGQIVAWKWEGIGSLIILGGFALFAIVNHGVPLNIVYAPWLITGLLYLACWWKQPKMAGG